MRARGVRGGPEWGTTRVVCVYTVAGEQVDCWAASDRSLEHEVSPLERRSAADLENRCAPPGYAAIEISLPGMRL